MQGILIAILVGSGAIDNAEDGSNLQNLLVCLEMLPAAIGMFYAFPYTEYKDGGAVTCLTRFVALLHVSRHAVRCLPSDGLHGRCRHDWGACCCSHRCGVCCFNTCNLTV